MIECKPGDWVKYNHTDNNTNESYEREGLVIALAA